MITDAVALIQQRVKAKFTEGVDWRNLGVYNRRYIAGTTRWSQHAWGNAWDIGVVGSWVPWTSKGQGSAGQKRLDEIYDFLVSLRNSGAPVGTILWRRRAHWNHIHVEGIPKKLGTPPLPGEGDDDMEQFIKDLQAVLNISGYTDQNGQKLEVDGKWGPKTRAAFAKMVTTAGSAGPHSHKVTIT